MVEWLSDSLQGVQYFHFLRPYWCLLFFAYLWIYRGFARRDDTTRVWQGFMSENILSALTISGSDRRWLSPQKVSFVLMILITLVLMGPSWKQQPSPFSEDRSALIIALDVSESMEQGDVQPSRLQRAKQKIVELLELRGEANTALIAYSGSAHVVMPMTSDTTMIRLFLDSLAPNIMPNPGKLPELSLDYADNLFLSVNSLSEKQQSESKQTGSKQAQSKNARPKIISPGNFLLIGDGASERSAQVFSKYFNQHNHRLIVWAMAAPEPDAENRDDSPWVAAQVEALQILNNNSNGRLVMLSHDNQDVVRVNRALEQNFSLVDDGSRPWLDSGYNLLFLIVPIFLLWFRRGWTLQW